MDREVKEQYQVLIQAKDMGGQLGGLAGTTTVNITLTDVNDNPPRFPKSKFSMIKTQNERFYAIWDKKPSGLSFLVQSRDLAMKVVNRKQVLQFLPFDTTYYLSEFVLSDNQNSIYHYK